MTEFFLKYPVSSHLLYHMHLYISHCFALSFHQFDTRKDVRPVENIFMAGGIGNKQMLQTTDLTCIKSLKYLFDNHPPTFYSIKPSFVDNHCLFKILHYNRGLKMIRLSLVLWNVLFFCGCTFTFIWSRGRL